MKHLLFLFIVVFIVIPAYAQRTNTYEYFVPQVHISNHDSKIEVMPNGDTVLVAYYKSQNPAQKTNQYFTKTYKGTPYFKNGWYQGNIMGENEKMMPFKMAYNLQKREVYLLTNIAGEVTTMTPPAFELLNHCFRRYNGMYYETLYEGREKLLKEYTCTLYMAQSEQKTGYDSTTDKEGYDGEFRKYNKFYMKIGSILVEIKSKKTLVKHFGNKYPTLENYLKTAGLDIKKETDLLMIFKYLDQL